MHSLGSFTPPPHSCNYLPDREAQTLYEAFGELSSEEYEARMKRGWRRFGHTVFRPSCQGCHACRSLRVVVDQFQPNRSQKRAWQSNINDVTIMSGMPRVTPAKLKLYDRYHAYQADHKGWPERPARDADDYAESFVNNPFPTEEWCYLLGEELIAVGYVDVLPSALSAIYFFYDPKYRDRSLGTFNVLSIIATAAVRKLRHAYLGYFVEGSRIMKYKSFFQPNQLLGTDGRWHDFLS